MIEPTATALWLMSIAYMVVVGLLIHFCVPSRIGKIVLATYLAGMLVLLLYMINMSK